MWHAPYALLLPWSQPHQKSFRAETALHGRSVLLADHYPENVGTVLCGAPSRAVPMQRPPCTSIYLPRQVETSAT